MRPIILAMGVSHRDVELACLWLRWVGFLDRQGAARGHLLVVYTKRVDPGRLQAAARGMKQLNIVSCPDEDESGYPRSASHLFLRTLEGAEKLFPGHAVLWCEPDTVPLRAGWAAELATEYQTCGRPFMGMRVGTTHPHLSGNAIYPANWRELAPSIATVLEAPDYKLWGPGKGQPWDVWCRKETTPQMAETKLMHQIWKERDARATRLKDIPPTACLFHQDKTGALIREIAAARYPEFMATLNEGRRFYMLNGHVSRLRAKGVRASFSFQQWAVGGWRSAVCSEELPDEQAAEMAALVGKFGLTEISEAEFLKLTRRNAKDLPPARVRVRVEPLPVRAETDHTHPSVFVMLGRYGDICNVLPMLKAEADAGRRPTLVVAQQFADILDGVSYVDRIVWEGDYDRLPEALRWLRRDNGILAPVVCQVHRNPTDKARLTDSYQKEVWRLAGRLEDFENRGPLVFDRRNAEREVALSMRAIGGIERPLILVGLESMSSPLAGADKILAAVRAKFGRDYTIVDLGSVRAERIYDLIGLYERARLVVAADTVHLHLTRGVGTSVIALLNDGWRGSVPNSNAVETIEYRQATPAAVCGAVDTALTSPLISLRDIEDIRGNFKILKDNLSRSAEIIAGKPQVFHAVDPFGSAARHHVAQSTWAAAYTEGMTPAPLRAPKRDARTALGDPRPLPFMKDILGAAREQSRHVDDVIVWTNSDIGFAAGVAEAVGRHVREHGAASMRRVESNGEHHVGRDLFAFTVKWLTEHWEEFPDYVIGAPVFDLGVVAMIRKHHRLPTTMRNIGADMPPADMPPGFALHESHASEWDVSNIDSVPSVRHNKAAFRAWAKRYAPEIKFTKGGNFQ